MVTQGLSRTDVRGRPRWRQARCGAASLGLLPSLLRDLRVNLLRGMFRLRLWFGLRQLCDVKHEADAQVELSQDGPELGDQVKLHDLTQQRVVPGCMSLELRAKEGRDRDRDRDRHLIYMLYIWCKISVCDNIFLIWFVSNC